MMKGDEHDSDELLRNRAKDWVVHLATGDATQADLDEVRRWCARSPRHAAAYAQVCRLWGMLETPLLEAQRHGLGFSGRARPMGRRAFIGGAVAASAAVVAGGLLIRPPLDLWPSLTELGSDYRTGVGEQRKLALGGDVLIEMNTRTSLNIREVDGDKRDIELVAGEAAVSAQSGVVTVRAAAGAVSAANAQFTLRFDRSEVRVTCLNGTVDVGVRGRSVGLNAGKQLAYADDIGAATAANPDVSAGWRDGVLVFENELLSHVIDEVNRYRPGHIVLLNAEIGRRRVSARFKLSRLDMVITQFHEVFGAKVRSLGGGLVMLS